MTIDIGQTAEICTRVLDEVGTAVVGKRSQMERIMAAALSGGHVLMEDYPGLGKTLIARSFATALGLDFKRIQFTPDLLPGDITGGYIYNRGEDRFELRQGPIFSNILLADEINRASPKTQSALLEAMQENQVTLEGETYRLEQPFFVIATQNPIEYEGTFPLPEAQLDRFLIKISLGYPDLEEEAEILARRRQRQQEEVQIERVIDAETLLGMREEVETVYIDADLEGYIVRLVAETRRDRRVAVGGSPRASLALMKLARAQAVMDGRDYVVPDDIKGYIQPVLIHRLILQPEFWMKGRVAEDVIESVIKNVPVPVISENNRGV